MEKYVLEYAHTRSRARINSPCLVPPNPADTDKVCAVAVAGTVKAKAKVCKVEMYFMVKFVVSLLLLCYCSKATNVVRMTADESERARLSGGR